MFCHRPQKHFYFKSGSKCGRLILSSIFWVLRPDICALSLICVCSLCSLFYVDMCHSRHLNIPSMARFAIYQYQKFKKYGKLFKLSVLSYLKIPWLFSSRSKMSLTWFQSKTSLLAFKLSVSVLSWKALCAVWYLLEKTKGGHFACKYCHMLIIWRVDKMLLLTKIFIFCKLNTTNVTHIIYRWLQG